MERKSWGSIGSWWRNRQEQYDRVESMIRKDKDDEESED
jgi:hypothetical protein